MGYTAINFFDSSIKLDINAIEAIIKIIIIINKKNLNFFVLPKLDHRKAAIQIINLRTKGKKFLSRAMEIAAKLIGNIQYPSTQTLYKTYTLPPKIYAFKVTIKAPNHIIIKITPNF